MEHAIYITNENELKDIDCNKFTRIYFGTEFCERLIPSINSLTKVIDFIKSNNLNFTFLTPWCTDKGITKLKKIIPLLPEGIEVVFNDWGVYNLISKLNLKPVFGRLLVSIKRDPRAKYQNQESLKQSNLDNELFQNFLKEKNIERIELDNVYQGYSFQLKEEIMTSLYYPFVYITTARKCITANCDSADQLERIKLDNCSYECKKYTFTAKLQDSENFILKGNSQFYKNDKKPNFVKLNVNRLVFMPHLPF